MWRRVTVADKRRPLQMKRCIPAACEKLEWTLMDLIIPFGGSDGFFHFVFHVVFFYKITDGTLTNAYSAANEF